MKDKVSIEELVKARFESATAPVPAGAWEAIQAKSVLSQASSSVSSTSASSGVSFTSGIVSGLVASAILVGGSSIVQKNFMNKNAVTKSTDAAIVVQESAPQNTSVQVEKQVSPNQDTEEEESLISNPASAQQKTESSAERIDVGSFEEAIEQVGAPEISQEQISITEAAEASFESSIQANKVGGESPLNVAFNAPSDVTRAVWDAGDGSPKTEGLSYEHTFKEAGTYTVTMIAQRNSGEFYQDQMMVTVANELEEENLEVKELVSVKVPNVFTPNSDGYNDEFLVSVDNAAELQLAVYNSVGRMVHQERAQKIAWNGKELDGSDAPTGTYFYQLKVIMPDGSLEIKKGSLTLTR